MGQESRMPTAAPEQNLKKEKTNQKGSKKGSDLSKKKEKKSLPKSFIQSVKSKKNLVYDQDIETYAQLCYEHVRSKFECIILVWPRSMVTRAKSKELY